MENLHPSITSGPSCQSPYPPYPFGPALHQEACFDLTAETWHAALPYMVGACHRPSTAQKERKEQGGRLWSCCFSSSPFKSTLQPAPPWPLMHPVHLARQSCETQDHRPGQKQFHPLIEPISTLHFETRNPIRVTVHAHYTRSTFYKLLQLVLLRIYLSCENLEM